MKSLIFVGFLLLLPSLASSADSLRLPGDPDCSGTNRWPTNMAFVKMKNAGLTDTDKLDFSKTQTVRIASEKIGDDLYRQVYRIVFTEKSGHTIEVLTVSDASSDECSMGNVDIYIVSRSL